MAALTGTRAQLYRRRLRQELARLDPVTLPVSAPIHPQRSGRIEVLFPADSAGDRKALDAWRGRLPGSTRVRLLGCFKTEVGRGLFDFTVLTPRQINWYGVPGGKEVADFLREPCELLMRLGPAVHPVLDYLAALKPAVLKVGPHYATDAHSPYHLRFATTEAATLTEQLATIEQLFTFTNVHSPS